MLALESISPPRIGSLREPFGMSNFVLFEDDLNVCRGGGSPLLSVLYCAAVYFNIDRCDKRGGISDSLGDYGKELSSEYLTVFFLRPLSTTGRDGSLLPTNSKLLEISTFYFSKVFTRVSNIRLF